MKRRLIISVVGAGLSLTGCGKPPESEPTPITVAPTEPATPVGHEPIPTINANPPAQQPDTTAKALPSWDDVKSGHPEGATNPPVPVLIVSPDGTVCHKDFVGPKMAMGAGDRIDACETGDCGTEIACPQPRAQQLVDAGKTAVPPTEPHK